MVNKLITKCVDARPEFSEYFSNTVHRETGSVVALPLEMRVGSQLVAAILGGPGVFYLWRSFDAPEDALRAVIFLGAAAAISLALYSKSGDSSGLAALQKLLVWMGVRKDHD
jgi:hypothetical protein